MYRSLANCANLVLIDNLKDVYLNLPPLLFAILYDKVTTLNSATSESPWTISRISPSLSSLSPPYIPPTSSLPSSSYAPLKQIKIALFRRILTYPLYRSLSLAENLWKHTIALLKLGKRGIIRLLLETRTMFMDGDWGVYSRIMWEDYVIWCQGCKERVLLVLADEMEKVEVEVGEIGFGLNEIRGEIGI
jgi:protein SHQ1